MIGKWLLSGQLAMQAQGYMTYWLTLAIAGTLATGIYTACMSIVAFANPLLSQGIVLGQHTFDRTRRMYDVDLELMPDRTIVPFIGYSFNENSGPGTTTYHLGQDEFRLLQDLHERDREIRAGASFHLQFP